MFPAYSNSNAVEKEDGELDDGEKYTSFDQAKILEARARKEAIAKANRLIERAKNENVVRYIYSDDSEDEGAQVHVAMPPIAHLVPYSEPKVVLPHPGKKKKKSKTSKRRNKKKKRAKRHLRSRSSSCSSGSEEEDGTRSSSPASSSDSDNNRRRRKHRESSDVLANKEKWGFLLPGQERSAEGSYIVFHKHYDHEIFLMDSLPKGHTAEYRNRFYSVLNGNERLDKIFFPKEYVEHRTKDRSDRYYGGGLRNLNDADAERIFRKKEPLYVSKADYIPLSQVKLQEFQFLHEVAEKKAASRERQEMELEISRTMAAELVPLEMRRFDCARKFADDPRNPDNLDQFLKVNEEMFNANRARGSTGDRKALVERQLSIIDKAISCNPRSADFRIKRLQYLKEIRPAGELLVEWEKMLNAFVNNCSVWENYLDHIQYDMALYKHDVLEAAFDRCFNKLTAILNGSFRSHKPEENTNVFLLQTYVRRLMWWMERGFTNRAIASVQATLEFHSQRPPALAMGPEPKSMEAFTQFWSSGVPRFGDRDAKGWNSFYERREVVDERQNPEIIERELQTQHITALENRIMSSRDDSVVCWVEMERELDIMESRPRRHLANNIMREEVPNTLKEVEMQDIRMFPCSKTDASATVNAVLPVLLRAVGVQFPKSMNTCLFYTSKKMPRPPTFQLLEEWNLLPTGKMMFSVPSAGAKNIALSLIQAMTKTTPCIEFVFSLLETKASQLDELYWSKAKSVRIARFEEYLREIMKELQSINFSISDEDFKLAIVVYALGILKRWVHDTIPESVVEAEKEQGKKRKKRDERPFTQDHFIEKMKNCLFKGLSNPLHLQSAGVLQVSLRLLLSLVEAQLNYGKKGVPRDYESNLRSVRETITNFLLRRECDKVSPTDTLAALDAWRQLVRTLDMPGKMFSCFESSSALCNALRIYFEFSRASRVSDQWIQECERLFASSQQFPSQDDKAVIVHAYIDVLEHHWRSRHTHKAKLKEVLEKAIIMCPYEGSFIRRFIDIFSGGSRNLILRRFFDGIHAKDDPTRDMYHSLSCLYMEQRRAEMLLEGGAALHSNAVALITRREAEQRKDPALWRLAMAQSRTKRCFDETYLSAAAQCGWSRHLHIDSVAASGGRAKCVETIRLMEERGALLFNDLDYIDVLKEHTAAQAEVPGSASNSVSLMDTRNQLQGVDHGAVQ